MKILRKNLLLVVFASLTACGGLRVDNIYNAMNINIPQKNLKVKDIENAIVTAGGKLGWVMMKIGEGKMKGNLSVRNKHFAEVLVSYNKEYFNIEYVDSKNLRYDPKEKTIHSNYNSWIKNLEINIQILLSKYSSSK